MEHYFSSNPQSERKEYTVTITCCDETITLTTTSSVFAKKGLDPGTRILLESVIPRLTGREKAVLDLGCGSGVIGILLKKKLPQADVWMLDVNPRAVSLAKKNCQANTVRCTVLRSDGLKGVHKTFDLILTNPPYHAGRNIVLRLLEEAWNHLTPHGVLYWVGRHQKGGKTIQEKLKEKGIPCTTFARQSGYRVYACARGGVNTGSGKAPDSAQND